MNSEVGDTPVSPGKIALVTPVFNDWVSLKYLVAELDRTLAGHCLSVLVLAVNDGSNIAPPESLEAGGNELPVTSIEVLNLTCNLGHQRAIALGLAEVARRNDAHPVIVMDADGEDRPQDIPRLLALHKKEPDTIIVASRAKRSEGFVFVCFYALYRLVFRVLTGKKIDFGNFSLIPHSALRQLVQTPEVWNHLAAAFVRSPWKVLGTPTARGQRYAGHSNMDLPALVLHGVGAMSVFVDILFARLLVACASFAGLSVLGIFGAVGIRFFTTLAIPGWATTVVGILTIFFVQILILMMSSMFLLLGSRGTVAVTPASQLGRFVASRLILREPVPV